MYQAKCISPMIPSYNLNSTSHFFITLLGFTNIVQHENYMVLAKDHTTIHILKAGTNIAQMEFYLEVDNVDTIWNNIKQQLTGIKVKEPFNQVYGMRELHIEVPDTKTLMFIGQTITE